MCMEIISLALYCLFNSQSNMVNPLFNTHTHLHTHTHILTLIYLCFFTCVTVKNTFYTHLHTSYVSFFHYKHVLCVIFLTSRMFACVTVVKTIRNGVYIPYPLLKDFASVTRHTRKKRHTNPHYT